VYYSCLFFKRNREGRHKFSHTVDLHRSFGGILGYKALCHRSIAFYRFGNAILIHKVRSNKKDTPAGILPGIRKI
jgi:hypothetical protein